VLLCNALGMAGQMAVGYNPMEVPLYRWATILFFVAVLAAIFIPGKRTNIALLLFFSALYPAVALTAIATGV
jgi:hypothetical protein